MRSQLRVNVQDGAIRRLDDFAREFASHNELSTDDTARIRVVIEELAMNLIKYGYTFHAHFKGFAEVTLELIAGQLTLEFLDNGEAFDPLDRVPSDLDQLLQSESVGGLGLYLVRGLVNLAQYNRTDGRNLTRLGWRISPRVS